MQLSHAVLIALLSAASQAAPTNVATSLEGYQFITPADVQTLEVLSNGETRTVNFYGLAQSSVERRQFYINPDQDKHYDKCGASTFTGTTSQYSPSVADCQCIVDGVNKRGGYWFARPVDGLKVMTQIISCGSCAFAVQSTNDFGTQVGDTDVRDLIEDAIGRFSKDGLIGAKGEMSCQNDQNEAQTSWTLMHVPN